MRKSRKPSHNKPKQPELSERAPLRVVRATYERTGPQRLARALVMLAEQVIAEGKEEEVLRTLRARQKMKNDKNRRGKSAI